MIIPEVKFKLANIDFEVCNLYYFSFFCGDWNKFVFKRHPKLKEHLKLAKSENERKLAIRNYVKKFWKENNHKLMNQRKKFQEEWDKINDKYMTILSDVLETEWQNEKKNITALISINPICPRILKTWTFSIFGLEKNIKKVYKTIAHEVLHFLYFKKWKEVFPKSKESSFESPHVEWYLSEILAPVILNNLKIQKIIKIKASGYEEFRRIKIGQRNLIDHFTILYKEHLKKKESFSEFLKIAYKEIEKYRKLIR